jgi:hypothetical protein
MPPALSLNKQCAITTKTLLHAPDNTPDTRSVVGVGEEVEMTAPQSAKWSASAGTISPQKDNKVIWRAPATDGNAVIKAKLAPGQTCSCILTVQAPNGLSFFKPRPDKLPILTAGVGMTCLVTFLPLHISLKEVQWREDSGPPTRLRGYFRHVKSRREVKDLLYHHANPNYLPTDKSQELTDHAFVTCTSPDGQYEEGSLRVKIPNRYKLYGESDGSGRVFATTIQAVTIDKFGTVTISKAGASQSRTLFG